MKTALRVAAGFLLAVVLLGVCFWGAGTFANIGTSDTSFNLTEKIASLFERLILQGIQGELPNGDGETPSTPSTPDGGTSSTPSLPGGDTSGGNGFYDESGNLVEVDGDLHALLYAAVSAGQTTVSVEEFGYTKEQIKEELVRFFFSYPEFFYIENSYTTKTVSGSNVIAEIELTYRYDKDVLPGMIERYQDEVAKIVAGAPATGSDFDKVLYFHDYLVRNYAYDYEGMRTEQQTGKNVAVRDAYTFFTGGVGVCQAYMLALIELCGEVDIPCLPVISDEMNHAWNLVQLGDAWYHVDVTWDDAGGADAAVYPSFVSYKYFLLSSAALYNGGRQVQWYTSEQANDTLYDAAPWHGANTPMLKLGEQYYCVLFDMQEDFPKIYCGSNTEMSAAKTMVGVRWQSEKGYYRTAWSGIVAYENGILLNTPEAFWYYDPATGLMQRVLDLSAELGTKQIFGICDLSAEGELSFVVAADYYGAYEVVTKTLP